MDTSNKAPFLRLAILVLLIAGTVSCKKSSIGLMDLYVPVTQWGLTPEQVIDEESNADLKEHILKADLLSGGCGGDILLYELSKNDNDAEYYKEVLYFFDENNQLVAVCCDLADNEDVEAWALDALKEEFGVGYEKENSLLISKAYWYTWEVDPDVEVTLNVDYKDFLFKGLKISYEKAGDLLFGYELYIKR